MNIHDIISSRISYNGNFACCVKMYMKYITPSSVHLPLHEWYTENACKVFRLKDYTKTIQEDINMVTYPLGYHIIIKCSFMDLNPFNMGTLTNHRHYYNIESVVDLNLVKDDKMCEIMAI